MKRYLCEKDFVMESGYIAFKTGKVYSTPSTHFPLRFASEGMSYAGHSMSEENMKGFRELYGDGDDWTDKDYEEDSPFEDKDNHNPMKRYECIKSGRFEMFNFTAGLIYTFDRDAISHDNVVYIGFTTAIGRIIWLNPDQIFDHFKELEPLDELYENPMEDCHPLTLMQERQIPVWARIAVAVFISAIVLFLIATL